MKCFNKVLVFCYLLISTSCFAAGAEVAEYNPTPEQAAVDLVEIIEKMTKDGQDVLNTYLREEREGHVFTDQALVGIRTMVGRAAHAHVLRYNAITNFLSAGQQTALNFLNVQMMQRTLQTTVVHTVEAYINAYATFCASMLRGHKQHLGLLPADEKDAEDEEAQEIAV